MNNLRIIIVLFGLKLTFIFNGMIILLLLSIFLSVNSNQINQVTCTKYDNKLLNTQIYLENDSSSKLNIDSQYQTLDLNSKMINTDKTKFFLVRKDNSVNTEKMNRFLRKPVEKSFEKEARLEMIKLHILNKLSLKSAPKIDDLSSIIPSEQLFLIQNDAFVNNKPVEKINDQRDEYLNINEESNESEKKIFLFPIKNNFFKHFIFNFTLNSETKYKKATLILETRHSNTQECLVNVNRLNENYPLHIFEASYTNLGTVEQESFIKNKKSGKNWFKYDITDILNFNNIGLLDLFNLDQSFFSNLVKKQEDILLFKNEKCNFDSAMITLEFKNTHTQNKRSLQCDSENEISNCCRVPFYVNFTSIGWSNWIIQPQGYMANYCKGKCDLSNARYHHTTVINKFPIIPQCCSPRKMRPLSLIYIDEKNFVFQKELPNMIVDTCDCA